MGKKTLLILLLVVLAGVAVYDLGLFKRAPVEDISKESGTSRATRLRLDLLEKEAKPYGGVTRDIFTMPQAQRPHLSEAPSVPEPEPVAPPPPSELQVFVSQSSYFGLVDKRAGRTVFINSGSEVLTVRKGDLIGGKFTVEEITESELVLKDSMTGEEARMTLQSGPR